MADISLRDFIHRKALENSNALEVPDPTFINEVFKCVFCLETPGRRSIPLHFCQSAEHPVCNLCVTAFMKAIEEPEETLICSAVEVDGGFCGGSISFGEKDEAETGVFSCTDILMSKWKGPQLEASLFAKQLLPNHTQAEFEVGFRNGIGSAPPDEKCK
ncbi:unnamed protein product [Orchesella dallaii]|uniref:Uncharacterized protein n=1 Tax=Orchesella dallaii TaxID=48710 RepID=A0ABP1RIW3_9HEXA